MMPAQKAPCELWPQDVDRHVGARVRDRRILLGLTQRHLAALIGVACQQAHRYEKGISRVSALRLHRIARALGVQVGHFYEGLPSEDPAASPGPRMPPGLRRSG